MALRRRIAALALAIASLATGLLATAVPASAAEAPQCWNTQVWARAEITRTYQLYCPRTDNVEVLSEPRDSLFEGLVQGENVKFRLTPEATAPEHDEFTLRLTGPGGSTDAVVRVHNVPLTRNTPPRCDPVSQAQRTPGTVPVAIEFHVLCWDDEHDDYTLYGNGPGTHPDAPLHNDGGMGGQGVPFWHYIPTIAAGEEQTTYYAIDALGARSADAPISVMVGPSVDRLPTCHPPSWSTHTDFNPILSRPGATRNFAVMCDDADGDPLQVRVSSAPTRGDFATFAPGLPSHGFWGTEVWTDVVYVPRSSYEGEDLFSATATGTRGDGPPGRMGIVARALPANSGAGCGWSPGSTKPGVAVTLEATCEDGDGDPVEVDIVSPPAHGQTGAPTVTPARFGGQRLQIVYTPDPGFEGSDSVTIEIGDGNGMTQRLDFAVNVRTDPYYSVPAYTIGAPFAWPELQPKPAATWLPGVGQAKPVTPLDQARKALGRRGVRLVTRIGDARVYGPRTAVEASARRRALAVTCPVTCDVTSSSTVAGDGAGKAQIRVKPGKAAALVLRLSAQQRQTVRRAGRARATFRLKVARTGRKARAATVRLSLRG